MVRTGSPQRRRLAAAASVLMLAVGFLVANTGTANAYCAIFRPDDGKHYWDGDTQTPGNGISGVSSDIWNYNPWVGSNFDDTLDYVMLQASGGWWAQIGRRSQFNFVELTFWQWTTAPNQWLNKNIAGQPESTFSNYKVNYNSSSNSFFFWLNGVNQGSVAAAFHPTYMSVAGEIQTLASQMPGAAEDTESNWNQTYRDFNNLWHAASPIKMSIVNSTYFSYALISPGDVDIYDKACPLS